MVSVIKKESHPAWTAEQRFISILRMHLSQNCLTDSCPGGRLVLLMQLRLDVMESIISPLMPDSSSKPENSKEAINNKEHMN